MDCPRFSIVLPTHNRHELLCEALRSLADQTFDDWEVIVVDDGSTPAVNEIEARAIVGERLTLHRHDLPKGVAAARNRGYQLAKGEFIAQVDDDDLLASQTLECADRALRHPFAPEILYIGIDAFGSDGADVNARQRHTLDSILDRAHPTHSEDLLLFGDALFDALLCGVPAAFQKPIWSRGLLERMQPMRTDDWPESAWAIEAAARSIRCALLDQPLYRWRRDGQSYFSINTQQQSAILGHIRMKAHLLKTVGREIPRYRRAFRRALSRARFEYCYDCVQAGRPLPWRLFLQSAISSPGMRHLSLLARSLTGR